MVRPEAAKTASRSSVAVAVRRTCTDSPRASVICEATVRCQIIS